tara:strand:+ start:414 stop:953 length:540 start_codon:yes stop_codon:yes gene_type:complete
MKIETNFNQYPKLRIDEQKVKDCIRKHFGTIKAPIYLYIDPKLQTAYGLHACRNVKDYERLPSEVIKENAKKNENHFHRISLSYERLCNAKSNAVKTTAECKGWKFPKWPTGYRFFHSYLMTLLSHELQHARQTEYGVQYQRHNWLEYDNWIADKTPVEYDACVAEVKKSPKMLRSYCE